MTVIKNEVSLTAPAIKGSTSELPGNTEEITTPEVYDFIFRIMACDVLTQTVDVLQVF